MIAAGERFVVWDPLVRAFHWSLAGFFGLAYCLEGDWPEMHSHAGYTVMLLVMFRILWGVIGSARARFSDFVATPAEVLAHLHLMLKRMPPRYLGHDPAGFAMITALLACLFLTAFTGMSLFGMEGSGPLAGSWVSSWSGAVVEDLHWFFANLTLVLIFIHVVGVLLTSMLNRENLVAAMLSGRKMHRQAGAQGPRSRRG